MIKINEIESLGWVDCGNPDRHFFTIVKQGKYLSGEPSDSKDVYLLQTSWHKVSEEDFSGTWIRIYKHSEDENGKDARGLDPKPQVIFVGNVESADEFRTLQRQLGI